MSLCMGCMMDKGEARAFVRAARRLKMIRRNGNERSGRDKSRQSVTDKE